jgi:UDP-N-acetyl-D-galactosamine dehydrogenase
MKDRNIAVIGLGYVGLPLVCELGRKGAVLGEVMGFDVSSKRIAELREGHDSTREVNLSDYDLDAITFTSAIDDLKAGRFLYRHRADPDRRRQQSRYELCGTRHRNRRDRLKAGDIVVYESTVYPGATEEVCVPLLEAGSGLTFNAISPSVTAPSASIPATPLTG